MLVYGRNVAKEILGKNKKVEKIVLQEGFDDKEINSLIENGNFRVEVTAVGELEGLVLSVPLIYEEYTARMQEEANFFNAKDDLLRVYQLYVGDVFTLSAEGFTGTPEVGKTVSVAAKKLVVA